MGTSSLCICKQSYDIVEFKINPLIEPVNYILINRVVGQIREKIDLGLSE